MRAWVKAVGDPKLGADALVAVLSQRLVRKLCTTCRVPYRPDPEALRKLNLPADRVAQLYKHSGQVLVKKEMQPCPACLGVAYSGRIGVFEVMVLDDQARALIVAGQLDQLRAYLRKQKMLWLQEAALARVVDGTTSIAEITRVLSKEPAEA
jgi:type II secretory ATPase GspE/PulE/Tfp pilus assembly ATPase PilB-like protein